MAQLPQMQQLHVGAPPPPPPPPRQQQPQALPQGLPQALPQGLPPPPRLPEAQRRALYVPPLARGHQSQEQLARELFREVEENHENNICSLVLRNELRWVLSGAGDAATRENCAQIAYEFRGRFPSLADHLLWGGPLPVPLVPGAAAPGQIVHSIYLECLNDALATFRRRICRLALLAVVRAFAVATNAPQDLDLDRFVLAEEHWLWYRTHQPLNENFRPRNVHIPREDGGRRNPGNQGRPRPRREF